MRALTEAEAWNLKPGDVVRVLNITDNLSLNMVSAWAIGNEYVVCRVKPGRGGKPMVYIPDGRHASSFGVYHWRFGLANSKGWMNEWLSR